MDIAPLIKMANQIGSFFEILPNHDDAVHEVASHIERFWNPRMRQTVLDRLDEVESLGMHALAVAAFRHLAAAQAKG